MTGRKTTKSLPDSILRRCVLRHATFIHGKKTGILKKEVTMLWTIALILIVLWALGLIGGVAAGGLIHLLIVVALVVIVLQVLSGRRVV